MEDLPEHHGSRAIASARLYFKNSFFSLPFDVDEDLRYYGQSSYLFEACVLKYKYLTWLVGDFWTDYLATELDDLPREELEKLFGEEKPYFLRQPNPPSRGFYRFNSTFTEPATWTFYDDQVPQWRKEW